MKGALYILISLLAVLAFSTGCENDVKDKKYVVGLSQCMLDDQWRQAMIRETQLEASNWENIELVIRNADNDNRQQISQIEELIEMNVDLLIISPFQSDPITPVAEKAYEAGIPTIITDRKISSDKYTTFIGADNYGIGRMAGEYAGERLPQNAAVLEIWGMENSSPARERHQGFADALSGRSDITFYDMSGDWRYDTTRRRLPDLEIPEQIDFIYAHNDMMAIAAREFFNVRQPGSTDELTIIGVDAVTEQGLKAVEEGRINASFLYPTGGEQVIRTAVDILNGKPVERYIELESARVDRSAARSLLIQSKTLRNYQQRIERQRSNIDHLVSRFRFLHNSLFLISVLLLLLTALIVYVFIVNKKIRHRNRELAEMNIRGEEQQAKLMALNVEIKEVTAQKLQFFTNVSHELRTPLTLILDPLDKLVCSMAGSDFLPAITLIHKNARRLLKEINKILDIRKLENSCEQIKIEATDIVDLAGDVTGDFGGMASSRGIGLLFKPQMESQTVWIDPEMIGKVLINLLSNAFKFTPDGGTIEVSLSDHEEEVHICVKDNGEGIEKGDLTHIFDRFYTSGTAPGTGLGLYIARQYMNMHGGDITADSDPANGTLFTVIIRKGEGHLYEAGHQNTAPPPPRSYNDATLLDDTNEKALLSKEYEYKILIVDDDRDILGYLRTELQKNFRVYTANNGLEALETVEKVDISLIVSDVMMPGMNGFELCHRIKNNVAFNHIPLILLTALTEERPKNYAISGGADDYVEKQIGRAHV